MKPRTLIVAALVFAAWVVSLYFNGYYDTRYAATTLLLLTAAGVALLGGGNLVLPQSRAALLIFAFWLLTTISLSLSTIPFSSLITWLVFLALPVCFFVFILAADGRQLLRAVTPLLFIGMCGLALWAIVQVVFFAKIYGPRAHDPLADANNLATLLNLGLLPALAWSLNNAASRARRLTALGLSGLLFAGLLATQSRGGFLCFLSGAVVIAWAMRAQIRGHWRPASGLLAGALCLFIAMQFLNGTHLTMRLLAFLHPVQEANFTARLAIWRATLGLIAQHPWRGTGFGTFYLYYPSVRPPLVDNSSGFWAHDDALQFATEMGLLAPVLFYGAVLAIAWRTRTALRGAKLPTPDRAKLAGVTAALLAIFLHSHIEFDLYVPPILIVTGIWLAAWHHLTAEALARPDPAVALTQHSRRFFGGGLAISLILLALVTISCASGQLYLGRAQRAMARANIAGFLDNIQAAERFAPASFIDPQVQLAGLYIDFLNEPTKNFSSAERRKMFTDSLDLLAQAQAQNPAWSEIDRKRAKLYMAAGAGLQPDYNAKALDSWQSAVQKNVMDFRARQEWAAALIAQGLPAAAATILQQGLEYPHDRNVTTDYETLLQKIAPLARVQQRYQAKAKSP